MGEEQKAARAVPPSRLIMRELRARGWAVVRLVPMTGLNFDTCLALVENGTRITPDIAQRLARVFDTSPELWMKLENNYQQQLAGEGVK